jgi:hypothetical protein
MLTRKPSNLLYLFFTVPQSKCRRQTKKMPAESWCLSNIPVFGCRALPARTWHSPMGAPLSRHLYLLSYHAAHEPLLETRRILTDPTIPNGRRELYQSLPVLDMQPTAYHRQVPGAKLTEDNCGERGSLGWALSARNAVGHGAIPTSD